MGPDNEDAWPYIWVEGHRLAKEVYKGFEIKLWHNSDIYPTIDKEFPQYSEMVRELPSITPCDFFRKILMYLYGGIYFDLDFIMYENIYNKIKDDKPTILEGMYNFKRPDEYVQNNLLASPPKDKIWLRVLEECKQNFYAKGRYKDANTYTKVMKITSNTFFTRYLKKYPNDFNVLPRDPYNLTREECKKINYKIPCQHIGTGCWENDR